MSMAVRLPEPPLVPVPVPAARFGVPDSGSAEARSL